MRVRHAASVAALVSVAAFSWAQGYEGSAPSHLTVLPKDISRSDLDELMKRYNDELGVECSYCHTVNRATRQIDYVDEQNALKDTARLMMRMTARINEEFLAELGDSRYADPFSCKGCHRGNAKPRGNVSNPNP